MDSLQAGEPKSGGEEELLVSILNELTDALIDTNWNYPSAGLEEVFVSLVERGSSSNSVPGRQSVYVPLTHVC